MRSHFSHCFSVAIPRFCITLQTKSWQQVAACQKKWGEVRVVIDEFQFIIHTLMKNCRYINLLWKILDFSPYSCPGWNEHPFHSVGWHSRRAFRYVTLPRSAFDCAIVQAYLRRCDSGCRRHPHPIHLCFSALGNNTGKGPRDCWWDGWDRVGEGVGCGVVRFGIFYFLANPHVVINFYEVITVCTPFNLRLTCSPQVTSATKVISPDYPRALCAT